ncbi:uncharacterized protein MAM_03965 [Metarhizium album ARSEF 1941]|uniref:Uncharacterized protein n=1 Tax=Metarhizium album (strain ARSEF 1941) TaxID=1081103 RepID=A0A0B2WX95_METAS|nr:uncharacterized protein MAM_03965 [Metarhizium album ARSEF 1941]KHN98204.1 hypothetical protein MAM_03965 [Metarhizium album ARSEF 1941]
MSTGVRTRRPWVRGSLLTNANGSDNVNIDTNDYSLLQVLSINLSIPTRPCCFCESLASRCSVAEEASVKDGPNNSLVCQQQEDRTTLKSGSSSCLKLTISRLPDSASVYEVVMLLLMSPEPHTTALIKCSHAAFCALTSISHNGFLPDYLVLPNLAEAGITRNQGENS